MIQSKGLENITVAESGISSIIDGKLTYRGIDIDDLAEKASFEEVAFLLWRGKLPNREELAELKSQLAQNAGLPPAVFEMIRIAPVGAHPMAILRTAVSALALYDLESEDMSKEANYRKAVRLQAKLPGVVAAIHRIRSKKAFVGSRSDFGYAQNFLYMLSGKEPSKIEIEAFDKALILHADHEFNASTFSARVTVATLADMHSGIVSAIGTLKGPLHGGANEQVMKMLESIGSLNNVEAFLEEKFANKEKIMGFGHRVYKDGDPRAKHLRDMSQQLTAITGQPQWYEMSAKIDDYVVAKKGIKPNVDFYSASVYHSLGIPRDLFTPIFAISRNSGWTAHILEQYENNRLIRPRAEYTGPKQASYIPIEKR